MNRLALKIAICNQKLQRMKRWSKGKKCDLQRQHRNLQKYMTSLGPGVVVKALHY